MNIKILGSGCSSCQKLEELAKAAVQELEIDATVEHVKDLNKIVEYGVYMTPGLVIDETVKASGKLPSEEDIKRWIQEAAK